ncbi:DNA (cytosine-5-)-methyltransferase [Clostridium sartagoforme]|uniref:Cytosine-specific methyltransferase n=1 Tax=Clostridium sartagoforme TaxID=84031 RepID=A0A4S2DGE0_9CLOT|nr:DNA (cytosine-5-)-methyltransferase [Clostridium sartagoforme]TGY41126.1 DNA (cytosine-5-)-methyltransferase [Clostridium sartagoforme]
MLRVVESFSGIGSQVKALKNIEIEHEILATMDWDINAIIAYDIIHHGPPVLDEYNEMTKDELVDILKEYTLSSDGKSPMTNSGLKRMSKIELEHLLAAIRRSNNLTSITDIRGNDLPEEIDLFTYSFPCQDLSIAGAWHGNNTGINRNVDNRSGMLWEVERILFERRDLNLELPKFLLMENVSNILSATHRDNFNDWKNTLADMGYYNKVYNLNAQDFGIPQKRQRVFMLSVKCNNVNEKILVENYFANHDLGSGFYRQELNIAHKHINEILKINYNNELYKTEANNSQPNDTPSRNKIFEENDKIYYRNNYNVNIISTITTKQDRNPNSGVIEYDSGREGKSKFRYLTPRECFMLMGFDEDDFQKVIDNNFFIGKNKRFFTYNKLYKLAGNSIVVNVLEYIFKQVDYVNNNIL